MIGKLTEIEFSHEESVEYSAITHEINGEERQLPIRRTSIGSRMGVICLEGVKWEYKCPHCGQWHIFKDPTDYIRIEAFYDETIGEAKAEIPRN